MISGIIKFDGRRQAENTRDLDACTAAFACEEHSEQYNS